MPPSRRLYARIAITLPAADLATADRLARQQDRPRSWLIAEAVREYAAAQRSDASSARSRGSTCPAPLPEAPGLGTSRRNQLIADLRLTPEQRVRAAEETARATSRPRRAAAHRIIVFDRYEDYLGWKRFEDAGG